jgi:hypothetical protein
LEKVQNLRVSEYSQIDQYIRPDSEAILMITENEKIGARFSGVSWQV